MKLFQTIGLLAFALTLTNCESTPKQTNNQQQAHLLNATLWQQHADEQKALYIQAFNWGKQRLSELPKVSDKPYAVVVDIDETVLDNSPYEAQCILDGHGYTKETWAEWVELGVAEPLPGAVAFSKFCESQDIHLFYISNRSINQHAATMQNLQIHHFAYADSSHILLKEDTSNKDARREKVAKAYEIVLFMGDNLGDFTSDFDNRKKSTQALDSLKELFGNRFIALPNAMYGSWEKSFIDRNDNTHDTNSQRLKALKGYK